jgi:hypothetical protein
MAWWRQLSRVAADYGFTGAVIGFVLSAIQFIALMALSIRAEDREGGGGCLGCSCILRLLALLGLTLGTGLGYMVGRWLSG